MNRRQALGLITASLTSAGFSPIAAGGQTTGPRTAASNLYLPKSFGAVGDGVALDSPAINAAISACSAAGGGVVYLPPGRYLCGTVELKSFVCLYLEAGSVILGSKDIAQYTPKAGPSQTGDASQRHLIFAKDVQKVSIVGPGTVDGQGQSFWRPTNRKPEPESEAWLYAKHRAWAPNARVSPMIELVNCTDLCIDSVEIIGASGWTLRPVNCTRVFIERITLRNPAIGPNTDGIDLTGCQDVVISDCLIDTGDDAICLKSENPYGDTPRLARNIAVTNCILSSSTTGFKIGTATQGGFENITFSNSTIVNTDPDLTTHMIAGIAIELVDGGWIDGIVISGIQIQNARAPLFIRRGDRSNRFPDGKQGIRGILIDGVQANGAILSSSITGLATMKVEDVRVSDLYIRTTMPIRKEWLTASVPEVPAKYPEARMFGWLPSSALYCRHLRGLHLKDVAIETPAQEWRSAAVFEDVQDLSVAGLRVTSSLDGLPPLVLRDVADAWVSHCVAPAKAVALASIEGASTSNLLFSGCDLRAVSKLTLVSPDVAANAIIEANNIRGKA